MLSVEPKRGLPTGTEVCNDASIVFDLNDPIGTPVTCNQIDVDPPVSAVDPMVGGCSGSLSLHWSGSDVGSGLATFSVFVSDDGGAPVAWLNDTTETSGVYQGQPGRTYPFHSVAIDHAGNREAVPAAPDVVVTLAAGCCTANAECDDDNPATAARHAISRRVGASPGSLSSASTTATPARPRHALPRRDACTRRSPPVRRSVRSRHVRTHGGDRRGGRAVRLSASAATRVRGPNAPRPARQQEQCRV